MKYEIPVCELIKLTNADIISTSAGLVDPEEGGSPVLPVYDNTDNG